jgi:single-strand DNA-binding protein
MASLNKVLLIGNLTRDPELRYAPSGTAVTTFTIAMSRAYNSNAGEKKEEVSYVRVVCWAKLAQICSEYLFKGRPVFVEGRLQSRSWQAPDGGKRNTLEVIAQSVQFLGKGKNQDTSPKTADEDYNSGSMSGEEQNMDDFSFESKKDEEVPF